MWTDSRRAPFFHSHYYTTQNSQLAKNVGTYERENENSMKNILILQVVDMGIVVEVISQLEIYSITKQALEVHMLNI